MTKENKYKVCPKCNHKNITFSEKCDHCNADIKGVAVTEATQSISTSNQNVERDNSAFCALLGGLSCIFLVIGILGGIFIIFTNGWAGFGMGVGCILSGLFTYCVLSGIKRILE